MKIASDKTQAFFWSFPFLVLSLVVFPYYFGGDQTFYRRFYDGVAGLPLGAGFDFYRDSLGTSEPGYFLFVYTFSNYLSKDILFSVVNYFLSYNIFLWLIRTGVSRLFFPSVYLNFYFLVLAFSAERLKLSLLFFLIGFGFSGVLKYSFYAASVFAHVQTLMLLAAAQMRGVLVIFKKLAQGRVGFGFLYLFFLILGMSSILFVLRDHIMAKIGFYYGAWGGLEAMLKPAVFALLSMYYAQGRRAEAFFASFPMLLAAYFIGAERVVIFSYFVFMFYGLQIKRGLNFGVIATTIYFSYKGVDFIIKVVSSGDGFAVGL